MRHAELVNATWLHLDGSSKCCFYQLQMELFWAWAFEKRQTIRHTANNMLRRIFVSSASMQSIDRALQLALSLDAVVRHPGCLAWPIPSESGLW